MTAPMGATARADALAGWVTAPAAREAPNPSPNLPENEPEPEPEPEP